MNNYTTLYLRSTDKESLQHALDSCFEPDEEGNIRWQTHLTRVQWLGRLYNTVGVDAEGEPITEPCKDASGKPYYHTNVVTQEQDIIDKLMPYHHEPNTPMVRWAS